MTDLLAARLQMATALAFHIVFAALGMGLPLLLVITEGLWLRTGNPVYLALVKRWVKAFAILFAVGAVSGTVLSFLLGLLWPGFMRYAGGIIGLPFSAEGFAFFTEAIFLGLYLYGWDRLSPRAHWLASIPIAISGAFSAIFVISANAWMNSPSRLSGRQWRGRRCRSRGGHVQLGLGATGTPHGAGCLCGDRVGRCRALRLGHPARAA